MRLRVALLRLYALLTFVGYFALFAFVALFRDFSYFCTFPHLYVIPRISSNGCVSCLHSSPLVTYRPVMAHLRIP